MKVIFSTATAKGKKMKAVFYKKKDGKMKKIKTVQFGQNGAPDYTITGDKKQRERYIKRHTNSREQHDNPMTAASLSRWVLWGDSKSKQANIRAFKKRFGLD